MIILNRLTSGGDKYSIPTLFALLALFNKSFVKQYFSMRKLRVGPFESLIIRNEGATGVSVNARRWVTPIVGARTRKSFSLLRFRS